MHTQRSISLFICLRFISIILQYFRIGSMFIFSIVICISSNTMSFYQSKKRGNESALPRLFLFVFFCLWFLRRLKCKHRFWSYRSRRGSNHWRLDYKSDALLLLNLQRIWTESYANKMYHQQVQIHFDIYFVLVHYYSGKLSMFCCNC